MNRRKKKSGVAALLTIAVLAALTVACALFYLWGGDRLLPSERQASSLDHVPGDVQAASPEEILVESLLEPEVEIRVAESGEDSGRIIRDDEISKYRSEILQNELKRYCYDHLTEEGTRSHYRWL